MRMRKLVGRGLWCAHATPRLLARQGEKIGKWTKEEPELEVSLKGGDKKPTEPGLQPLSRYSDGIGNIELSAHVHRRRGTRAPPALQNFPPKNHAQGPLVQVLRALLSHNKIFKVVFTSNISWL